MCADRKLFVTDKRRTLRENLPRSVTFARFEALRICFKIGVGNGDSSRKTVGPLLFLAHCSLLSGPNISVIIFCEGAAITTRSNGSISARRPLP